MVAGVTTTVCTTCVPRRLLERWTTDPLALASQARWVLLEVQKENYTTKLKESEDRLKSAEGREIRMSEQLRRITEAIKLKTQENEILLRRYVPPSTISRYEMKNRWLSHYSARGVDMVPMHARVSYDAYDK